MGIYVNSGGVWTLVPITDGAVRCNNGNTWTNAKEVWGAEETTPGVYQWTKMWEVIDPPNGVTPSLEQWDGGVSVVLGGDVRASWINASGSSGFTAQVEFEINSLSWGIVNAPGTPGTSAILDRSNVVDGDGVRARMRYTQSGVTGLWSAWSTTLTYFDF